MLEYYVTQSNVGVSQICIILYNFATGPFLRYVISELTPFYERYPKIIFTVEIVLHVMENAKVSQITERLHKKFRCGFLPQNWLNLYKRCYE